MARHLVYDNNGNLIGYTTGENVYGWYDKIPKEEQNAIPSPYIRGEGELLKASLEDFKEARASGDEKAIRETLDYHNKLLDMYSHSSGSSSSGGCFIATAVYGTPFCEEINILRYFRDMKLDASYLGRKIRDFYYKFSPPIADFIRDKGKIKKYIRKLIVEPAVKFSKMSLR